jgi:hypothetical protein
MSQTLMLSKKESKPQLSILLDMQKKTDPIQMKETLT